ncbi:MAG: aminotransferase [Alphaproteobacteria bacterium]|nr:aminotransferase [Alphaproteobacteria bacterium]MBU0798409.1 aminotransferase [Alphaproteobacteria bacterium]MBU0887776.1 aminotransferase [Alphaproteobacteria bacterium]MBU1815001.1 aminotransferase [Alphaproteobacteria bacterium]MBU2090514.1 aminotransferase [Alphaproteobacteria bacterium]
MKPANTILSGYGTSVFEVMSRLAIETKAINLGQGFPDTNGPEDVVAAAQAALADRPNQYPPMMGVPELRQAVARHNKRFYDLDVDWQTETMVTSGATEALSACLFGLIEPGDEVVLIEPLYDCYLPMIRRAGGIPKLVRVEPPRWELPYEALAAAFSDKTKLILLNSPMNPAAKVFTAEELGFIAGLVQKHDAYAVCDEVYEHIVFDGLTHHPLMTLPGMRERCVRIGSAGKTFSLTGWKVGYVTACPALLQPISKCHQFLVFTTPPNLQRAVAFGLEKDDSYFNGLAAEMQAKRDRLSAGLARIGFSMQPCQGTYFVNAGFAGLGFEGDDVAFCRHITEQAGVCAIPVSAFYQDQGTAMRTTVRFCFSKQDTLLDEAVARLEKHFGKAAA